MAENFAEMMMNQAEYNSAWNASQAQINRDWQEYMSSTSHQREVGDLIAAGLNPVLSANSGSTWQAVGNATADPTSAQGLASMVTTLMNNQAQIEMSKISAEATKAAAGAAAAATMYAAQLNNEAAHYQAEQAYNASTYAASINALKEISGNPYTMMSMQVGKALSAVGLDLSYFPGINSATQTWNTAQSYARQANHR